MNGTIIDQLTKLAKQIKGSYRRDAIRRGLRVIKGLDFEIRSSDDLKDLPFIGKGIRKRVDEILDTGSLSELEPSSELEGIIGIGSVKAKQLEEKGIKTVSELKTAVSEKKVKLSKAALLGLKYYGIVEANIPRKEITEIKSLLEKEAHKIDKDLSILICGSYRREKATSNDIDVLLYHPKDGNWLQLFIEDLFSIKFLLDTLGQDYQTLFMGFCQYRNNAVRRIDIRYVPIDSLEPAKLYFTGPFELNQYMRSEAKNRGMLLNEHGLWKITWVNNTPIKVKIPITSEADIFHVLSMDYLTPKERESFNSETRKS